MSHRYRYLLPLLAVFGLIPLLASCSTERDVSSTSDTHVCVFDGSDRGGQRLKFQLPPGADSRKVDDNDQVVRIPASNRFWMVNHDRSVADPGTPNYYTGNAAGGVPIFVEGQIRFRFNLDLACEWYSLHGRRNADENGDLGFNVRGDPDQGWFRFGNENFVQTMQEVISEEMYVYQWPFLHYNYPVNADDAGQLPDGATAGESTRQILGERLGDIYTERLIANLGGEYFCGIETSPTEEDPCPPIRFQVTYAGPNQGDQVSTLVQNRQRVEDTRTELESTRLEGELRNAEQSNLIAAEQSRAALLEAQRITADLQAQIDTARCAIYASFGLDCEGHHAPVVVAGSSG